MELDDAKRYAQTMGNGWRVPTIQELYSIVERGSSGPAINQQVFPDLKIMEEGAAYWSLSRVEEMPRLFYYIDFRDGRVDGHTEGFSMAVRLVRTRESAPGS